MNKTTKKLRFRFVWALLLLALFFVLIYREIENKGNWLSEWQIFKNQLNQDNFSLIVFVLLLAPCNWLVEAFKWQTLLAKIERVSLVKAFKAVLSGIAFAFITPNKTGDFIGRILFLKKQHRLRGTMASFVGSLSQMVVTFFFGLMGMIYLQLTAPRTWTLAVLILVIVAMGLLLYFYFHIALLGKMAGRFKRLRTLAVAFFLFRRYSKKELAKVVLIAFVRFCIYNGQFLLLMIVFNAALPVGSGFLLSGLMFWLIMVIPTFFVADIGVRGLVTTLVFINTGVVNNAFSVLAASYLLWLINLILPAIIGSLFSLKKTLYQ